MSHRAKSLYSNSVTLLLNTHEFLQFLTFISMVLPKLKFLSWFVHAKAYHGHKFTKWKFEDTKCKHGRPYWIWIPSFALTTGNLGRGYGSWQAAEIQITQADACGVHFEQRRRDDTWLFAQCGPRISRAQQRKIVLSRFRRLVLYRSLRKIVSGLKWGFA